MRQGIQNRKKHRALITLLAVALVAAVVFPVGGKLARAEGDYSLTVKGGSDAVMEDIKQADMRVDIYQIATGEKDAMYDTWHWTLTENYLSLAENTSWIDDSGKIIDDKVTNNEYAELANAATKLALEGKVEPVSQNASSGVASFSDLEAGLYVILPRDKAVTDDTDVIKDGDDIHTVINTDYWTYKFNPSITAIPSKQAKGGEPGVTPGEIGTAADFGPWLDEIEVVLKPTVSEREGKIKIIKNLLHYETKNPVTFVFSVVATKDNKTVYDDVVSMSFGDDTLDPKTRTNPGSDERIIDGLPVGATVTVTEIYPEPNDKNAYYKLVDTAVPKGDEVLPNDIIEFTFTNDYNERYHGGGGAENQYVFIEDGVTPHWDTHQVINGQEVVKNEGQDEAGE